MIIMVEFRNILSEWYKENGRFLPWRTTSDPYAIWISEIILQQTQVKQGIEYYERFVSRFPDIESLALADESEVLKVWQGLGYYSRARNLHHTAKLLVSLNKGRFPENYDGIRKLKGIGDYTAAAIASIAFNLPYAAVDGNVYRFLSRIYGISVPIDNGKGKKVFADLAGQLIDEANPGLFNQAMMEFGALQCVPRNPDCEVCPFANRCSAYGNSLVGELPVKSKRVVQRNRYFNFLVVHSKKTNKLYLQKRLSNDIWANLYQFPLLETEKNETREQVMKSDNWSRCFKDKSLLIGAVSPVEIHLLSHQKLHIRFWELWLEEELKEDSLISVTHDEIHQFPVPKPIERYIISEGPNW